MRKFLLAALLCLTALLTLGGTTRAGVYVEIRRTYSVPAYYYPVVPAASVPPVAVPYAVPYAAPVLPAAPLTVSPDYAVPVYVYPGWKVKRLYFFP